MRWAVVFLVVTNLAVYFWLTQDQKAEGKKQPDKQAIDVDYDEVSSLRFVGEPDKPVLSSKLPSSEAQEGRIAPLPASRSKPDGMCRYVGPFAEKISAKQVALRLNKDGALAIDKRKAQIEPLYWVYYPPLGNAQLALRKLREFQSQQIDSFLVTKGEYANAISLGYFSKKSSAISVRRSIEESGYDAQMMEKKRFKEQFWVDLGKAGLEAISAEKIAQASADYPEASVQKKLCKTVASK